MAFSVTDTETKFGAEVEYKNKKRDALSFSLIRGRKHGLVLFVEKRCTVGSILSSSRLFFIPGFWMITQAADGAQEVYR